MTESQFWGFLEGVFMIILAHHGSDEALGALTMYNIKPDKGLEIFSRMALEECKDWRNGTVMKVDLVK